jgi:anti-sigma factor RsiW
VRCIQAQSLNGYFDGELDAVRAAEFDSHLQACPACAQALAAQQGLPAFLALVWPWEKSDAAFRSGAERGYTWIRWRRSGMRFWAVSDVAAADLEQFARRLSGS